MVVAVEAMDRRLEGNQPIGVRRDRLHLVRALVQGVREAGFEVSFLPTSPENDSAHILPRITQPLATTVFYQIIGSPESVDVVRRCVNELDRRIEGISDLQQNAEARRVSLLNGLTEEIRQGYIPSRISGKDL